MTKSERILTRSRRRCISSRARHAHKRRTLRSLAPSRSRPPRSPPSPKGKPRRPSPSAMPRRRQREGGRGARREKGARGEKGTREREAEGSKKGNAVERGKGSIEGEGREEGRGVARAPEAAEGGRAEGEGGRHEQTGRVGGGAEAGRADAGRGGGGGGGGEQRGGTVTPEAAADRGALFSERTLTGIDDEKMRAKASCPHSPLTQPGTPSPTASARAPSSLVSVSPCSPASFMASEPPEEATDKLDQEEEAIQVLEHVSTPAAVALSKAARAAARRRTPRVRDLKKKVKQPLSGLALPVEPAPRSALEALNSELGAARSPICLLTPPQSQASSPRTLIAPEGGTASGASAPHADEEGHELFLSDIEDMLEAASLDDKQQPCKTAADAAAAAAHAADAAADAAAAAAADAAAAAAAADATTAEADAAVATAEAAAPKESHFYHLWSAPVGEVALLLAELQAQSPLMDVRDYWHHGGSSPGWQLASLQEDVNLQRQEQSQCSKRSEGQPRSASTCRATSAGGDREMLEENGNSGSEMDVLSAPEGDDETMHGGDDELAWYSHEAMCGGDDELAWYSHGHLDWELEDKEAEDAEGDEEVLPDSLAAEMQECSPDAEQDAQAPDCSQMEISQAPQVEAEQQEGDAQEEDGKEGKEDEEREEENEEKEEKEGNEEEEKEGKEEEEKEGKEEEEKEGKEEEEKEGIQDGQLQQADLLQEMDALEDELLEECAVADDPYL